MEALLSLWNHREELLAAVGAVGVAFEGGALALLAVARILAVAARFTGSTADDRAIARAIGALEAFAGWIPRLRTRGGGRPAGGAIGPALAVVLVLGAGSLAGCGASGFEVARAGATGGALAVVAADPILAGAYDQALEAFEAGELAEDAYAARLARLDRAERALRSLASSLTAVDLALEAAEDGQECGLRPAVDGAVDAAAEVLEAFDAAGLEVPALVSQVLGLGAALVDAPECGAEELAAVSS